MNNILSNPWDLINEIIDENMKEEYELDNILVNISSRLINFRVNNNITQKDLAKRLDISQAMVSKLESGDYNPTVGQLWKVSKKLGWRFNVIFEEDAKDQIWKAEKKS